MRTLDAPWTRGVGPPLQALKPSTQPLGRPGQTDACGRPPRPAPRSDPVLHTPAPPGLLPARSSVQAAAPREGPKPAALLLQPPGGHPGGTRAARAPRLGPPGLPFPPRQPSGCARRPDCTEQPPAPHHPALGAGRTEQKATK